ncbi:hypothetical protein NCS52_01546700 [Fusarium sp. LHS14.1]|nr:hypothetical protein NCS52_01546700 [Fusarium sp. LHS14.1]
MSSFKALPAAATLHELCAKRRNCEFYKTIGPVREYKPAKEDAEVIGYFRKEYEPKIKDDALLENQRITAHRNYRPRELDIGSIASPGHTITVFIPLTLPYPFNAPKLPDVMYQPDRETEAVQEPMPWHIGVPIQIPGNSRIVVKQGTICFEMVQYDWEPAKDPQREEEAVVEAS